jgi:hypothetical protein
VCLTVCDVQVFRAVADVIFFVIGSLEENELMLWSVLTAYIDTISLILKYPPFARSCVCMHESTELTHTFNSTRTGTRWTRGLSWRTLTSSCWQWTSWLMMGATTNRGRRMAISLA